MKKYLALLLIFGLVSWWGVALAGTHSLGVATGDSIGGLGASDCAGDEALTISGGLLTCYAVATGTSGSAVQATYITQTCDAGIDNEQCLTGLSDGMLKVNGTTGILSNATAGTDYITTESDPTVDTEAEIEGIIGVAFGDAKTETSGYFWVADGDDMEMVAMSGDATLASGGAIIINWDDQTDLESDGAVTWGNLGEGELADNSVTGADLKDDLAFGTFPTTPESAPDADYEVANKKYVDDNAGGGASNAPIFSKTVEYPEAGDHCMMLYADNAITIDEIKCITDELDEGETVTLDINECDSSGRNCVSILSAPVACDNNGTTATISDGGIDANDWIELDIDSASVGVTHKYVTIVGFE